VLNNLFLSTATATVLVGTLYPLAIEAVTGDKISVGEPFFNLTFGPVFAVLLVAVPFGPLLAWKRGDLFAAAQRLTVAFALAALAGILALLFLDRNAALAALGIGLAFWLIFGALTDLALRAGVGKVTPTTALRRLAGLPRSAHGTALAHLGLGLSTLGVVAVVTLQTETILTMKPGETVDVAGYTLRFEALNPHRGPNYTEDQGVFPVFEADGDRIATIVSSKRLYTARRMPTTEAGIETLILSQLYVSLGDETDDGGVVVRVWWKPLVTLIWLGALVMMIGGTLSLADRRLRVGAPARPKKAGQAAAAT
jgi:cytochrome c-type biogenesis protein CcmF